MRLILLGPPGSGKGTQALRLAQRYDLAHISTGDMLRHEIDRESDLGLKAKPYMEKGELVPGDIILGMIEGRISESSKKGFVLDGFPRDISQAEALGAMLKGIGKEIDLVIDIKVDSKEIFKRLAGRRVCHSCEASYNVHFQPPKAEGICDRCGGELYQRHDDREETVKRRLDVYFNQTAPLIDYYRKGKKLKSVDGNRGVDEVFDSINSLLDSLCQ